MATQKPFTTTHVHLDKEGGEHHVAISCYPLMGPAGLAGAIEISKDITRDIMMQRSLMQQEKLASIGRISAGVAHEINNPLTTVLTTAMLLQEDLTPEDPLYQDLDIIARETLRCRKIVLSLLDFARQGHLKKETLEINPIVAESVALARKQAGFKGIQITHLLADGLPAVLADRNQLQQAFINLLVNAIEATAPGGAIEVATRCDPRRIEIRVVISDTGYGMPSDVQEKIFDPFFTTKESGTGLGLAITHGIIEQHGGRIDVDSTPGQGTTFMIILPAIGPTP
jgi:signal transduction histidine kinase